MLSSQSLPRILADSLQRSDGEEEEDGFLTLSPASLESSPDSDQLHWEGLALPLPVTFEQELEGGISVCLVDLVRQMHPYCMSICMEDDEGEQMLPEGGILLEVVDQGENGEHILVIQNINLPVALPLKEQSSENRPTVSDEAEEVASDSSEHIVVDDDDETPVTVAALLTPSRCSDLKDNMIDPHTCHNCTEVFPIHFVHCTHASIYPSLGPRRTTRWGNSLIALFKSRRLTCSESVCRYELRNGSVGT